MKDQTDRLTIYLQQIQDSINKIETHVWDAKINQIEQYPTKLDACLMQLIHIGELMNKINKKFPDFKLDWIILSRIIWLRNFVAHDYLGLNLNIIKRILDTNIPELKTALKKYKKDQ